MRSTWRGPIEEHRSRSWARSLPPMTAYPHRRPGTPRRRGLRAGRRCGGVPGCMRLSPPSTRSGSPPRRPRVMVPFGRSAPLLPVASHSRLLDDEDVTQQAFEVEVRKVERNATNHHGATMVRNASTAGRWRRSRASAIDEAVVGGCRISLVLVSGSAARPAQSGESALRMWSSSARTRRSRSRHHVACWGSVSS